MAETLSEQLLHGILFGILIGLLVYNLFIFTSLRDISYIYYIFFIASMILQISSYSGYLTLYMVPNLYYLSLYFTAYTFGFVNLALVLFTDVFLKERANLTKENLEKKNTYNIILNKKVIISLARERLQVNGK